MARILYGVHGIGHGHAVRGLTLARHFREHEFLFVSCEMGAEVLRGEFATLDCPQPESPVRTHRLSLTATRLSALKGRTQSGQIMHRLREAVDPGTSRWEIKPGNVTRPSRPYLLTNRRSSRRSGPSPARVRQKSNPWAAN